MKSVTPSTNKFADGCVYFWIEQGTSIHLKASSPHHDPVELTAEEAREIALALLETARLLDSLDSPSAASVGVSDSSSGMDGEGFEDGEAV